MEGEGGSKGKRKEETTSAASAPSDPDLEASECWGRGGVSP